MVSVSSAYWQAVHIINRTILPWRKESSAKNTYTSIRSAYCASSYSIISRCRLRKGACLGPFHKASSAPLRLGTGNVSKNQPGAREAVAAGTRRRSAAIL